MDSINAKTLYKSQFTKLTGWGLQVQVLSGPLFSKPANVNIKRLLAFSSRTFPATSLLPFGFTILKVRLLNTFSVKNYKSTGLFKLIIGYFLRLAQLTRSLIIGVSLIS